MKKHGPKLPELIMIVALFATMLFYFNCQKSPGFVTVHLRPGIPDENSKLRWSPKGKKLPLTSVSNGLETKLFLGQKDVPPILLRLERSEGQKYYDRLLIDQNRNESLDDEMPVMTTAKVNRGKIWSSFAAVVTIPITDPWNKQKTTNPYPISFWYVENPAEQDHEMVLRFSRRGWMQGEAILNGVATSVLVTENKMDGVFDNDDSWVLAPKSDPEMLFSYKTVHPIGEHAWLGEKAYRIKEIDPSGRKLTLMPVDPGLTRAEEEKQKDTLAPDRNAPRSGKTVLFVHDFEKARQQAKKEGKSIFVDFETTWCGPCQTMNKLIYTADAVVAAAKQVVAVKVDGDQHPELVTRFNIKAYPTTLLVTPGGTLLKRTTGYQSVRQMVKFLSSAAKKK